MDLIDLKAICELNFRWMHLPLSYIQAV